MESPALLIEYRESLFEQVEQDIQGNKDIFDDLIQSLCTTGYLECCTCPSDDSILMYKAKSGLTWSSVVELSDPIKKKILLQLIENPKCFFVLFNTQKGKLRIIGKEIASWAKLSNKRVVSFLVVSNDRTLSEQSVNGLFECFPIKPGKESSCDLDEKYDVRIYELSSNNKVPLTAITTYIDAYAYNNNYSMPLIVILANNKQVEKLVRIIYHIINHPSSSLCIGGGWDEADQTYPRFRDKVFHFDGKSLSFKKLLDHPSERVFRNGFITATEGDLVEEEYDECANAYHYPVHINPEDTENYFAFHHNESKVNLITVRNRESNNTIAERVISDNWDTLSKGLKLRDGSIYNRKIIINSDSRQDEMEKFAKKHIDRANILTFNMRGIKLYLENGYVISYSASKQNLNRLLFYIYKMNSLENRILIIIGRRKVDRGLGFHYSPRKNGKPILKIEGKDGILQTDGKEGLIWTDMIMGNKIEHIPTAVQKAGRGAGIIRQCPQYPGEFNYWIDKETSSHILRHYKKVDTVNELRGSNSILQAVSHANALLPEINHNHSVNLSIFRVIRGSTPKETLQIVKNIVEKIFNQTFRAPQKSREFPTFLATSLNNKSEKVDLLEAIKKVPGAWGSNNGIKTYRRFMASYKDLNDDLSLHCVIPLIDPAYTEEMKNILEEDYQQYFVTIPQEGNF